MKRKPATSTATPLRRRASARLKARAKTGPSAAPQSAADTRRLLHELQVHQIELEMQNEELQQVRSEIEAVLEQYSDLYEFAPVGYLTLDRDGTIREANLMAASLLGIPRAELVKKPLRNFLAQADRPPLDDFLRQVFARGERKECDGELLAKGKAPVQVRMRANLFESGQTCRLTVSDITLHRQAEEDRLVVGKLESTGILAGGIAHDFNNLLTAVLLNIDMARMLPSAGEKQDALLVDARLAVLRAHDLTQQLITFAEGGAPVRTPTHLPGIIQEATRLALGDSGLACEFSVTDDLWLAEVDHEQIGQVVRNLVLNAREAMPGGGAISIRLENVVVEPPKPPPLSPGRYIRASITDHGGGIPRNVLPRIFDPYFSTKQRGSQKGMGLGLTICRAIIQKHGGTIAVFSTAETGTTFHLYLPALEPAPACVAAASQFDRLTAQSGSTSLTTLSQSKGLSKGSRSASPAESRCEALDPAHVKPDPNHVSP
jgi:PAS domain S-box-containing protein